VKGRKSLRKRENWKKLWQRKHIARLSKLSFPRYTTSLATNAMRSPDPCSSHTPHGTRHTHVSDHRRSSSSSLDLPDLANSATLSLAHHISINLLAAMPPQGRRRGGVQGLLSAPIWTTQRARTSSLCPLRRPLSSDGLVTQMVSSVPLPAINTACNRCNCQIHTQSNPDGEHVALCSTPQGITIQNCLSTHGSAATCSGIRAMRTDSSTN
jgi:hypothetical protein